MSTVRRLGRLTWAQAQNARPGPLKKNRTLADGGGLLLRCTLENNGNIRRYWCFRYQLNGKIHDLGIGPLRTIDLYEARKKAKRLREQIHDGLDPIKPAVIEFTAPLPKRKNNGSRAAIVDAIRAAYPHILPETGPVAVHVFATVPPHSAVADVDNLIKPVLDAMAGVAYVNDTQVNECLVRRTPPGRDGKLLIKVTRL